MGLLIGLLFAAALASVAAAGIVAASRGLSGTGSRLDGTWPLVARAALVAAAFAVDRLAGFAVLGLVLAERIPRRDAAPDRRPTPGDNAAFSEWEAARREEIAALERELDRTRAEFAVHLEERRRREDEEAFSAFRPPSAHPVP